MRKLKLLIAACALMGAGQTWAQMTDVTTTYITNPSFESNGNSAASNGNLTITGWTETQSSAGSYNDTQTRDASTASSSAFGSNITPADGTYYLFYRHGWNGDAGTTATFTNTSKTALPAGVYRIEFMYQQSYSEDSSSKTNTRIKFAAKNSGSEVASVITGNATKNASFTNDGWNKSYFIFNLEEAATIDFEFTLYSGGQKRSDFLLDGIRLLKADNPAEPIADGTTDLYFYNEKTGQYLSAGATWGTHAIVDNTGQPITATLSNGVYTLTTQEFNKYLNGLYMDGATSNWLFLETEASSGKYYLTSDGLNYLTSNGAGAELINVTEPTDASVWTIVSKADRKAAMASATIANPANATFLISDPNFGRNAIKTVWNGTSKTSNGGTNLNLGGGNNENFCAESYHATFSIHQSLTELSTGVYSLTAQGFYRVDNNSTNESRPYFYLGDANVTFPLQTGTENDMNKASTSFSAGSYTTEPIYVRVEDGNVEVGAKLELEGENYDLWCIWDNFQLKYYGDVTVAEVRLAAFVDAYKAALEEAKAFTEQSMFADAWTTLQTAITANELDLNDAELTESDLTTATANLVAANTAANAAVTAKTTYDNVTTLIGDGTSNVDLTSQIDNPSFENTAAYALVADGWVNEGVGLQGQTNTGFDGYRVGNVFAERWAASGSIGAFKTYQTISALPAGLYKISAVASFNGNGATLFANDVTATISNAATYAIMVQTDDKGSIELGAQAVSPTGSWFKADNFTLEYLADFPEYALATGKMGKDKKAAQEAAETTFLANKTVANYNSLLTAITEAEASVANYAALKAAIDKAEAVKEANNFVTSDAATTFANEISTATAAWDKETYTDADAITETATLGTAVSGYHGNATGKAGNYMVSTWDTNTDGQTAGSWNGYYINTWSTEGDNDGSGFSVPFFEYYTGNEENLAANTFTATLSGLENGCYDVTIWARVQRRTDADFNADNSMITMSVNGGEKVSIMSNTSNKVGTGNYVMRLGRYTARGMVTDGTLTLSIDVKLGANVHWLSWRDVKYTKVADEAVEVSDAGFATYVSDNDLDFTNISGLTAYKATVEGSTIKFSNVTTVPAGEGVLLKAAQGNYNIPVTTGVASWADNDFIRGTGEAVPSEDGGKYNYILNKVNGVVGFYKANGQTVAANRAYIQTTTTAARLNISFDDDDQTTGIARVEETVANDAVYTLSGVRVAKPTKGLYIMNGKKVVVK